MEKKYTIIKWEKNSSKFFDTEKDVVIVEIRNKNRNKIFDQNDIDKFMRGIGIDHGIYDNPYSGVDGIGFSSNKNYDLTFFYIDKDNSIRMSIVSKNKEARIVLDKAIGSFGNQN